MLQKILAVIGAIVVISVIIKISNNHNDSPITTTTGTNTVQTPAPNLPADETRLINAVISSRRSYDIADNDMLKGATRPERGRAVCNILSGRKWVSNWIGKITKLQSNNDGKGVVYIGIGDDIEVATYNNSFRTVVIIH
jgi:hypothetical protein